MLRINLRFLFAAILETIFSFHHTFSLYLIVLIPLLFYQNFLYIRSLFQKLFTTKKLTNPKSGIDKFLGHDLYSVTTPVIIATKNITIAVPIVHFKVKRWNSPSSTFAIPTNRYVEATKGLSK